MTNNNITSKMKRHAVIVSIKAKHIDFKIARFLKLARSFVCKVRKELKGYDIKTNIWPPSHQTLILWIILCEALLKEISIP